MNIRIGVLLCTTRVDQANRYESTARGGKWLFPGVVVLVSLSSILASFGGWSILLGESNISLIDKLMGAGLGKSRQVYASKPRREILIDRQLGAGLGKSRQV